MKQATIFKGINSLTLCAEFGPESGYPYEFMKQDAVADFINGTSRGRSTNVPMDQLFLAQKAFDKQALAPKAA